MATADIKISLIRNNPPGFDRIRGKWVNLNEEYVELENKSNGAIDISGWVLVELHENPYKTF